MKCCARGCDEEADIVVRVRLDGDPLEDEPVVFRMKAPKGNVIVCAYHAVHGVFRDEIHSGTITTRNLARGYMPVSVGILSIEYENDIV